MQSLRNPVSIQRLTALGLGIQRLLLQSSPFVENTRKFNTSFKYCCLNVKSIHHFNGTIVLESNPKSLRFRLGESNICENLRAQQITTCTLPLFKKSRSTARSNEDDDRDDENDEELDVLGKGDKILKVRLSSDRIDAILKAGLQMSRNKIEKAFYADRIRVNGERPKKKSQVAYEGDEVDIIRRYNIKNPDYLDVSRLEILEMGNYSRTEDEDSDDEAKIPAKIRRSKSLTIENYPTPFKGNIDDK